MVQTKFGSLPPVSTRGWLRFDLVSRILTRLRPATILEIGCGQGSFGARLAGVGDYLGVEPDPVSFSIAEPRITSRGGAILNGTDAEVPPGQTFDLVCAFEVLEHLEDDEEVLRKWIRHVRPGGTLLLSVPAFQSRFGPMDDHAGHFRRYDPADARRMFAEAGLTDIDVMVYGWPIGFAFEAVRNRLDAKASRGVPDRSMEELTAASGRILQPGNTLMGVLIMVTMTPFRYLQRLRPNKGVGLVILAKRPLV